MPAVTTRGGGDDLRGKRDQQRLEELRDGEKMLKEEGIGVGATRDDAAAENADMARNEEEGGFGEILQANKEIKLGGGEGSLGPGT